MTLVVDFGVIHTLFYWLDVLSYFVLPILLLTMLRYAVWNNYLGRGRES